MKKGVSHKYLCSSNFSRNVRCLGMQNISLQCTIYFVIYKIKMKLRCNNIISNCLLSLSCSPPKNSHPDRIELGVPRVPFS